MPSEEGEIVRRAFDLFIEGRVSEIGPLLEPSITLHTTPDWPEGNFVGIEAVLGFFERWRESVGTQMDVEDVTDCGNRVAARLHLHLTGAESGLEGDMWVTQTFTVREGRIILIESFWDHDEALRRLGLG